jgi:exonuclease III
MNIPGNNDIMAIQIKTPEGQLTIFNIYNNCTHSRTLTRLRQYIQAEQHQVITNENNHIVWAGDFNRHHPLWDNDADERLFTTQATRDAEVLLSMVVDKGLVMALPKGLPTLKHMVSNQYSRPDNVWCSRGLTNFIVRCDVDSFLQPPNTDHFPIVTIVDILLMSSHPSYY